MQDDRPTNVSQHESLARHPVRAAEQEAEHLRKIADEGENPRTPAILVGTVLLFIVPIVALLIALAFTVAHFVG